MSETLREFYFRRFVGLFQLDCRPSTLAGYRCTLDKWAAVVGPLPFDKIGIEELAKFRAWLAAKYKPPTVNKHLRNVAHILGKIGPPGRGNRDALGLVEAVPWVRPVRSHPPKKRPATIEEIAALVADSVVGEVALACWLTGSRIGAILALRREDVDFHAGKITFAAQWDKCGTEREKPLADRLGSALRRRIGERDNSRFFREFSSRSTFYRRWGEALDRLGWVGGGRIHPHAIRRAVGTFTAKVADPWTVRFLLDHSHGDTAGKHYIDTWTPARKTLERAEEALAAAENGANYTPRAGVLL